MKTASSKSGRQLALNTMSAKIHHLGGYPFFGTALGIVRNGGVLELDDDVDFIVPQENRASLEHFLMAQKDLKFTLITDWIIQVCWTISSEDVLLDFYFFWEEVDDLRLPWNFYGTPWRNRSHLLVPKKYLAELEFSEGEGFFASGNSIASYLYGPRWKQPMRKNVDYEIRFRKNRPRYFYPSSLGRLARERALLLLRKKSLVNDVRRILWMMIVWNPFGFLIQILEYKGNRDMEIAMLGESKALVLDWNNAKLAK